MTGSRKGAVAIAIVAAVIAALAAAGWTCRRPLAGRWWMWRLASGDAAVRETAARKLGELRWGKSVPLLADAAIDRSQGVRLEAALALRRIDPGVALFPPFYRDAEPHKMKASFPCGSIKLWILFQTLGEMTAVEIDTKQLGKNFLDNEVRIPQEIADAEPALVFSILELMNLRAHQDGILYGDYRIEYRLETFEDETRQRAREIYLRALGKEPGSN